MAQENPLERPKFMSVRQIGLGGLVTKPDPQDLKDTESPDMRNIIYDSGIAGPRFGTTLVAAKPNGETGTPSQLLKVKDSNGTTYLIAVYGTNFYLFDTVNIAWVKLNGTIVPTQSGLFYGSASWNLGTGTDKFYFGNGVDYVMSWIPQIGYLSLPALSTDTVITVKDSSLFGNSQAIIVGGQTLQIQNNCTGGSINLNSNPTNGQTLTLIINGVTVNIQFVTSVTNPGDVKIDTSAGVSQTGLNLIALLQNPTVTSSTQVALSAPEAAAVALFTYTQVTDVAVQFVPTNTVYSLVVSGGNAPYTFTGTNPLNVLSLTSATGAALAAGAAVTNPISQVPSIPKGNIFLIATAEGAGFRLFVAGVNKNENVLYYSKGFDSSAGGSPQEDFTTSASTLTGGFLPIIYGEGGIVDLVDFGSYLAVVKINSLSNAAFTIDTTNDVTALIPTPIEYGESVFPVGQQVNIVAENSLYIPTLAQGIYQFSPSSTGNTLTTTLKPFSDNILTLFNNGGISFSQGRREFFNRKLFYLCSSIPGVNNLVLINDFTWDNWSIWDNLNAVDIKESNNLLYFLCQDDGGLYFYDQSSFQDFREGTPVGYESYIYTKRFDAGMPANPMQQSLAMLQGYITANTKLYVDVLYNEGGSLALSTYIIDGSNPAYVYQVPVYGIGRAAIGSNPVGGAQIGTIGFFRVYLDLLYKAASHVIQFKCYTQNIGDNWGLTGLAFNPEDVEKIPTELVIGIN